MENDIRKAQRSISWVYRFLFSYILVLLIPMGLLFSMYSVYSSQLIDQIDHSNRDSIALAAQRLEDVIKDEFDRYYHLYNSLHFRNYINRPNGYTAFEVMNLLKLNIDDTTFISEFCIWNSDLNKIISEKGSYSEDVFFSNTFCNDDIKVIRQLMDTISPRQILKCHTAAGSILYLYFCPIDAVNNISGRSNSAFLSIMPKDRMIEYLSRFIAEGELDLDLCSQKQSAADSDPFIFEAVTQNDIPFFLTLTMDKSTLLARTIATKTHMGCALIVLCVICLCLSIIMSRYLIRTIRTIYADIQPYGGGGYSSADELKNIHDVFENIISVNDELGNRINEQKNTIRQQSFSLILADQANVTAIANLKNIGVPVDSMPCFVTLIFAAEARTGRANDIIIGMLEEMTFPSYYEVYSVEVEQMDCVAAIAVLPYEDHRDDALRRSFSRIIRNQANTIGLHIGINVGMMVDSILQAGISLNEAASLGFNGEDDKLFTTSQIANVVAWKSDDSRSVTRLVYAVQNGNQANIDQFLMEVFVEIDNVSNNHFLRQCAYYDLYGFIANFAKSLNVEAMPAGIEAALVSNRRETYQESLGQYLHSISSSMTQELINKANKKAEAIIQYLIDNYNQYDISIDKIIDEFNISANQISRLLRQKTGYGFKDYLINLRMNKAKDLLINSEIAVNDISKMVGYGNTSYFIKSFKAFYGLPPAQYRKQRTDNTNQS